MSYSGSYVVCLSV